MSYEVTFGVNFLKILSSLKDFKHEVGGLIYGSKDEIKLYIKTLTVKHGDINFLKIDHKDINLYFIPQDMQFLGTWHSHPVNGPPTPSNMDIVFWNSLDKSLIHAIVSFDQIIIYKDMELIAKYFFTSKEYGESMK